MNEVEQVRLHVNIYGRVQGVGFRAFAVESGIILGVTGWARNKWDGSVEVVAEGERKSLKRLLAALHQGPRMARVDRVNVEWQQASGEFKSFYVRSTI